MMTIKDIAKQANCSIRTVSRVFNYPDKVNTVTREKIVALCKQYDYKPNFSARALKTKKSNTIGVILGTNDSDINRLRVDTLTKLFSTSGYALLVNRVDSFESEKAVVMDFKARSDALIVFSHISSITGDIYSKLMNEEYPFILIDPEKRVDYPAVYINRVTGYRDAVIHLLNNDRKKLVLLFEHNKQSQRLKGVKEGIEHFSGNDLKYKLLETDAGFEGGYSQGVDIYKLINSGECDSVICQSDKIACGLLNYLINKKVDVPGDVSITGFDNDNYTNYTNPPMTTIVQGGSSVSVYVYEQLINKLEKNIEITSKTFDTQLLKRVTA